MEDIYSMQIKRPRTIDRLEIINCMEIVANDLARYGIPDSVAARLVEKYIIPLNKEATELKKRYSDVCSEIHRTVLLIK